MRPVAGRDTTGAAGVHDEGVPPSRRCLMQIPMHDARMGRLRFTVTDEPGRLAAAAAALADLGINILSLDFHLISATEVIDEATVSLPPWLDVPAVEHALRGTGATDVWAVPIPVHQLEDIATRVLRLADGVLASRSDGGVICGRIAAIGRAHF